MTLIKALACTAVGLVAKDFKPKSKVNDEEGLFAATPPLELVTMLEAA